MPQWGLVFKYHLILHLHSTLINQLNAKNLSKNTKESQNLREHWWDPLRKTASLHRVAYPSLQHSYSYWSCQLLQALQEPKLNLECDMKSVFGKCVLCMAANIWYSDQSFLGSYYNLFYMREKKRSWLRKVAQGYECKNKNRDSSGGILHHQTLSTSFLADHRACCVPACHSCAILLLLLLHVSSAISFSICVFQIPLNFLLSNKKLSPHSLNLNNSLLTRW